MSFLSIKTENQVATVALARQDLHNAFNDTMITELTEAFASLGQQTAVRTIVLAAQGKSFCAGADLNWMQSMLNYTFDENVEDAQRLAKMLMTILTCPKPVIGRIHGAAFGGGVGLVSVCDMSVAISSATFSLSEVKLGLMPAVISPFVLRKIGASNASRYFLTAERFSAAEAHRIGLISEVAESEETLGATITAWITALKQNGPEAVSLSKKLIQDVVTAPHLDAATTLATHRIAERRISAEGQEGMRAFLEKRPAAWTATETNSSVS